jgi:hypothetical protein
MNYSFGESRRYFFEKLHNLQILPEGKATDLHFIDAVDIEIRKELHIVVDVCLIALKTFVADDFGVEKLSHVIYIARVIEIEFEEGLLLSVIAVKIILVLKFSCEDNCFVGLEGQLV